MRRKRRRLTLKKALRLEQDRLSRGIIDRLRHHSRGTWKYPDKKK